MESATERRCRAFARAQAQRVTAVSYLFDGIIVEGFVQTPVRETVTFYQFDATLSNAHWNRLPCRGLSAGKMGALKV
jgi:hypothetical protein